MAPITYVIHHHPDHWEQPQRFDPERFTTARSEKRHRAAWIPFALGQHQCIGKEFALIEGMLILANLAQRYHLSPGAGTLARPLLSATLRMHEVGARHAERLVDVLHEVDLLVARRRPEVGTVLWSCS